MKLYPYQKQWNDAVTSKKSLEIGPNRFGKSLAMAEIVAQSMRRNPDVTHYLITPDGKIEKIVGVPGLADGRQLEDKTDQS